MGEPDRSRLPIRRETFAGVANRTLDGSRPDWGKTKLDFSMFPPEFLSSFQIGSRLSLEWLDTVTKRTRTFMKQLPKEARPEKRASVARKRQRR